MLQQQQDEEEEEEEQVGFGQGGAVSLYPLPAVRRNVSAPGVEDVRHQHADVRSCRGAEGDAVIVKNKPLVAVRGVASLEYGVTRLGKVLVQESVG